MNASPDEAARNKRNLRLAWAHGLLAVLILAGFVIVQAIK